MFENMPYWLPFLILGAGAALLALDENPLAINSKQTWFGLGLILLGIATSFHYPYQLLREGMSGIAATVLILFADITVFCLTLAICDADANLEEYRETLRRKQGRPK